MKQHAFSMESNFVVTAGGVQASALAGDSAARLSEDFHWHRIRRMSKK